MRTFKPDEIKLLKFSNKERRFYRVEYLDGGIWNILLNIDDTIAKLSLSEARAIKDIGDMTPLGSSCNGMLDAEYRLDSHDMIPVIKCDGKSVYMRSSYDQLTPLAYAFCDAGWQVIRKDNDLLAPPGLDLYILWAGDKEGKVDLIEKLDEDNSTVIYAEWGFLPQKDSIYLDPQGTGANSTLCDFDLETPLTELQKHFLDVELETYRAKVKRGKVFIPDGKYVFAALQMEKDKQITAHSPIKTNYEFMKYLNEIEDYPVYVKPHPLFIPSGEFYNQVNELENIRLVDQHCDLISIIKNAECCVVMNSNVGNQVIAEGVPLVSCADSIYNRISFACDPDRIGSAVAKMIGGHSRIPNDASQRYLYHLFSRQLTQEDLNYVNIVKRIVKGEFTKPRCDKLQPQKETEIINESIELD